MIYVKLCWVPIYLVNRLSIWNIFQRGNIHRKLYQIKERDKIRKSTVVTREILKKSGIKFKEKKNLMSIDEPYAECRYITFVIVGTLFTVQLFLLNVEQLLKKANQSIIIHSTRRLPLFTMTWYVVTIHLTLYDDVGWYFKSFSHLCFKNIERMRWYQYTRRLYILLNRHDILQVCLHCVGRCRELISLV